MVKISEFEQFFPLLDEVTARLTPCASLEQAAGEVLDIVVERLGDSIVLTRLFATLAYSQLPSENREFVERLTADRKVRDRINDETPILSLIASRGVKPNWNDRRQSVGHVGIPLVSADFVESIPMIARLLAEVGLESNWLEANSAGIDIDTLSRMSGVFYVQDAQLAVDQRGRKIITAQDFVRENNVHTVFGVGGGFAISRTFLALLFFCNERIEKAQAAQFLPLISTIKAATASLISKRAIFS